MNEQFKYLVEKYLSEEITPPERTELDAFLQDKSCREYFEKARQADGLIKKGFASIRQKLENGSDTPELSAEERAELESDLRKYAYTQSPEREMLQSIRDKKPTGRTLRLVLSLGSAAAAVALGFLFVWKFYIDPSPDRLYKRYYEAFEFGQAWEYRGSTASYDELKELYLSGQYHEVVKLCESLRHISREEPMVYFIYGISLMELKHFPAAIEALQSIPETGNKDDTPYIVAARYYLALAYLKQGDLAKTREHLQILIKNGAPFRETELAGELIKKKFFNLE